MEVDVETESPAWISSVEAGGHYGGGDDEKEGYHSDYGVTFYQGLIAGHRTEAVSHACGCESIVSFVLDLQLRLSAAGDERARVMREVDKPLYRIVSKFNPTKLGNRKSFLVASQVPSPTSIVFEE